MFFFVTKSARIVWPIETQCTKELAKNVYFPLMLFLFVIDPRYNAKTVKIWICVVYVNVKHYGLTQVNPSSIKSTEMVT